MKVKESWKKNIKKVGLTNLFSFLNSALFNVWMFIKHPRIEKQKQPANYQILGFGLGIKSKG